MFIDNRLYIDALLNQLTILPIIIYGDHETWSDARRTRRTWSQSTIRQAHAVSSYSIGAERRMESNKATYSVNDNHSVDSKSNDDDEGPYVIYERKDEKVEKDRDTEEIVNSDLQSPLDPWSIVWYIGSFGGLVAFFLIVSCSEWCCRRGSRSLSVPYAQRAETINTPGVTETPPPPYHLFAPPSYDSVNYGKIIDKTTGEKVDIYVISVPIHRPMQAPA
ncbi:uncharacterized protein LOC105258014 isoform X2 [Camponotus floridanus]|uniref:uncharacterized protein LOC105258014 isoform X2 n=1 Tax=Camponotus floridanus TaxID=104421 RepID=UPI00097171B0|nr:uncharacterized protein LOC105258014 isoform X2 [Camponotus floridanus]